MANPTDYPLASGYRAASRLNLQHYLWKQQQGYLTHPKITRVPAENLRIADIGTGTGIWLLDLSDSLPASAQLHGFDIDLTQCPPGPWLPPNVSMHQLNIYDNIPDDLVEQYDIIHIRFFICVVKNSDPAVVLRNILKMLKPNGWVQWTEQDLATCRVVTAFPNAEIEHTEALKDFALAPTPQWPFNHSSWVATLAQTFKELGLQEVLEDRQRRHSWHLSHFEDVLMIAMEEMSLRLAEGPAIQQMIQKAAQEFENNQRGIAITSDRVTLIGKKP